MKTKRSLCLLLALTIISAQAQVANGSGGGSPGTVAVGVPLPAATSFRVVERGANHRIWQRESYEAGPNGHVMTRVHKVTELNTGMHYQQNGEWVESKEVIEGYATGAIARQGPYQVIFANNLNTEGSIELQTPDHKQLKSNILGLGYYDSSTGQAVLVARIKDSYGALSSGNQVIYQNAFDGVTADVRYTYRKSGFEQDIIIREQPPTPESFGLNPATTKLEAFTEFINPPPAAVTPDTDRVGATVDEEISWGTTRIGHGRAFDLSNQADRSGVAVQKKYITVDGRRILVELVPLKAITAPLSQLPLQSSVNPKRLLLAASEASIIPTARKHDGKPRPMRMAMVPPPSKGYVMDYATLDVSQTDYTFQGDMTYYISGNVNLSGVTTIEGGAVIKFNTNYDCAVNVLGTTVNCQTGPYRPAIFTSMNDSTVGESTPNDGGSDSAPCTGNLALHVQNDWPEDLQYVLVYDPNWNLVVDDESYPSIIAGSSSDYSFTAGLGQGYYFEAYDGDWNEFCGQFNPTLSNGTIEIGSDGSMNYSESGDTLCTPPPPPPPPVVAALTLANGGSLHDLHICNVSVGIIGSKNYSITNVQFVNCGIALQTANALFYAGNILLSGVGTGFYGQNFQGRAEQLTFDQGTYVTDDPAGTETGTSVTLVNVLLTGVGGYGVVPVITDHVVKMSDSSGIYQVVGAGSHYLATGSPYANAGTASINPALLAELGQRTTYPPVVYSGLTFPVSTNFGPQALRGNTEQPSYGYHYDCLDFAIGGANASSNITFSAGTAVGWFESSGYALGLANGMKATFTGTATTPCIFARYSMVQEGGNGVWTDKGWWGGIVNVDSFDAANPPTLSARFTDFSKPAAESNHFRDGTGAQPLIVQATHCEFLNGAGGYNLLMGFTNCLFVRAAMGNCTDEIYPYEYYRNCTFHGGSLGFGHWESAAPYWKSCLRDCSFEGTMFSIDDPFGVNAAYADYNYNAYLSEAAQPPGQGAHTNTVTAFNWQSSWFGNYYLPPGNPLIQQGSTTADKIGLYHFTTQINQVPETNSVVTSGYHYVATDAYGNPLDTDGDGLPDYLEDANGNGIFDAGDLGNWLISCYNGLTSTAVLQVYTPLK